MCHETCTNRIKIKKNNGWVYIYAYNLRDFWFPLLWFMMHKQKLFSLSTQLTEKYLEKKKLIAAQMIFCCRMSIWLYRYLFLLCVYNVLLLLLVPIFFLLDFVLFILKMLIKLSNTYHISIENYLQKEIVTEYLLFFCMCPVFCFVFVNYCLFDLFTNEN